MESLIILIPIALAMVALGIKIFFWAVDNDQFDDLEGPAHSILFDDDKPKAEESASDKSIKTGKRSFRQ